ncbi:hypothetical protein [Xenorhabdus thailandensis]|uniref:hypothetical protein n=1 Tax=Xenorhabdus thailandensis TaxID=3136255 RepID=UPI0030F4110E
MNIETYAETYRTHDIVYANHHHHDRNNQEKNTILKQLQAILENGTQAKVWQVDHPHITTLLIYAGVHGATDDIIVSSHSNREVFIHAVIANCLRMVDIVDDDTLQNHSC